MLDRLSESVCGGFLIQGRRSASLHVTIGGREMRNQALALQEGLGSLVSDEKQGSARRRSDEGASHACVNAAEAARGRETARGLDAGLDGIDGV